MRRALAACVEAFPHQVSVVSAGSVCQQRDNPPVVPQRAAALVALLLLCALGVSSSASTARAAEEKFSAPKAVTFVLGDSLAFGFQRAKFLAGLPNPDPANFDTGFADVFAARLAATPPGRGSTLVNLGCPGETTVTFLNGGCLYTQSGFHLHVDHAGSQMAAAVATLEAHRGQVSPILISLGANDLLALANLCGINPACIGPLLPGVLAVVAQNYVVIMMRAGLWRKTGSLVADHPRHRDGPSRLEEHGRAPRRQGVP